jgi:hypothetical protein
MEGNQSVILRELGTPKLLVVFYFFKHITTAEDAM